VNGPRFHLALLVGSLVVLAILAYERGVVRQNARASVYSTYDNGPSGYLALYDVLGRAGVAVSRFESELPALDPSVRTLVLTGYEHDPNAQMLDERDTESLRRFVARGGRFVALDAEFAGPQDVTPGVGTSLQTPGEDAAVVMAHNVLTSGIASVAGSIEWTFPFHEPHGVPLLANGKGVVAVWYRFGRGDVIAVTAPEIFGNSQLQRAGNLRFAYNAIAGHGPVAFDEFVHGYSQGETTWAVLPAAVRAAVCIAVALAVLALVGANVPFAPPYLAGMPDERDSSQYIDALAALMARSRRRSSDDRKEY
jgi:hypothetical protein